MFEVILNEDYEDNFRFRSMERQAILARDRAEFNRSRIARSINRSSSQASRSRSPAKTKNPAAFDDQRSQSSVTRPGAGALFKNQTSFTDLKTPCSVSKKNVSQTPGHRSSKYKMQ